MQWWLSTVKENDEMTGPAARARLSDAEKEIEALKAKAQELTAEAGRTKETLISAANGSYVKVKELIRDAGNKG